MGDQEVADQEVAGTDHGFFFRICGTLEESADDSDRVCKNV